MRKKFTHPMVSVIIPTYQRPELLKDAIESVLGQTLENFEIIVINDGGNNKTKEVVFAFKDPRIRYIAHQKNKGVSASKNTGLKNSKGEYIMFLDDDDMLPGQSIESLVSIIKEERNNPKIGAAGGSILFFIKQNGKTKFTQRLKPSHRIAKYVTEGGKMGLIKKVVFENIGYYDENLLGSEDTDFCFRFFKKYWLVATQQTTYYARRHLAPSLHNSPGVVDDYIKVIQRYGPELKAYPKRARNIMLRTIGVNLCLEGKVKEGQKYLKNSIKENPFHIKTYIVLLAALIRPSLINNLYLLNTRLGKNK